MGFFSGITGIADIATTGGVAGGLMSKGSVSDKLSSAMDPADIFGGQAARRTAEQAQANMDQAIAMAKGVSSAADVQSKQALDAMKYYDLITKGNVGESAEDYMAKQQAAAEKTAEETGQKAATQGTIEAAKAARTAGLSKGQSALAATQGAGDIYSNAFQQGVESGKSQYNTAVGTQAGLAQDMSTRNINAMNQKLGAAGIPAGIGQSQTASAAQQKAGASAGIGAAAGAVAGLLSDENAKKNIKEVGNKKLDYDGLRKSLDVMKISKIVKPITYEYKDKIVEDGKGKEGEHLGVTVQDLEKTPLADAVITGDDGLKRIDTNELSPMLLNLIIQLAKKVDVLEGKK